MEISGTVRRLAGVPRQTVAMALDAPQQVNDFWDEVTQLLRRARRLLDRGDLVMARLERNLHDLDLLAESSLQLTEKAGAVADFTDTVTKEVRSTRELAEDQARRVQHLLDAYQPILESLAPTGREVVSSLHPTHVRALSALLDELPNLVARLRPALDGMGHLVPHLEEVTDRMDNVGQVVEGLPGAKVLRRRGKAREEEADD